MTKRKKGNQIITIDQISKAIEDQKIYNDGWNAALDVAYNIACAIDSKRGNEKLIAQAIFSRKVTYET